MSSLTPPTDPLSFTITGDMDLLNAITSDNGDGTLYVRNGGLYVEGLTDLDKTSINTSDGEFNVSGSNKVNVNISGGATSSIEFTAEDASFFTTTASTLALSATDTTAGKVTITGAGNGANSVLIDATNATDGQVTVQSAGASTSVEAIKILATDTTDGDILIQGSGSYAATNPAVKILSDNATSGKIQIESAGDSASIEAIELLASGTTGGNVLIQAKGLNATDPAIKLLADNATSGQVFIQSDGAIDAAVRITATDAAGGIDIDANDIIAIDTTDTTNGITIATGTAGVPVTIGTATSLTTIVGDLTVSGTTTTINTETLTVEDNIILINSGNGEIGLDSGVLVRRFQDPNAAATGDVVTNPDPVQESGAFQAGSSTPGTLVLGAHASDTDDFYNGWWILVTSGTGINQVRRVKDYVGSTKTVTIYVTADNVDPIIDGLDLVTAPAAADTYSLYSAPFSSTFYDESLDKWTFATIASQPDAIGDAGISTATIQQYQDINSGALDVFTKTYDNALGSTSGTVGTFTLLGHGIAVGDLIKISNSADFTPAITTAVYTVATVPDVDTFTVTLDASTVSTAASSATLELYETSVICANVIKPHNPDYPISISGLICTEDIPIVKTSSTPVEITGCTDTFGAYLILVGDLNNTDGAFAIFSACSSGTGGSFNRLAASKGVDGQRLQLEWGSGNKIYLKQQGVGSGAGSYTYRLRIYSLL